MAIDHERFMRRCLELAVMAREQGNTPVGSVVVFDGAIIGAVTANVLKVALPVVATWAVGWLVLRGAGAAWDKVTGTDEAPAA